MSSYARRMQERRERDRIERLNWLLRDVELESKAGYHEALEARLITSPPPALSAAAAAGMLGAAALSKPGAPFENEEMSRRRFFSKGALVAGGVTAGVIAMGEAQRAQAWSFWGMAMMGTGFVIRETFASVIGWVVNRFLDRWFPYAGCGSEYVIKADDLEKIEKPKPSRSSFHNSFATGLVVDNKARHFETKEAPDKVMSLGVSNYVLPIDPSGPELVQQEGEFSIKKEKGERPDAVNLPTATRRDMEDMTKHGESFRRVCAAYKYKPGDMKPLYQMSYIDADGAEYMYYGAERGKDHKLMIARVTGAKKK